MSNIRNALVRADQSLFFTINNLHIDYLNRFFLFITNIGGVVFQISLIAVLMTFPDTRTLGNRLAFIQIAVTAVVQAFKYLFARTRPYNAMIGFTPLKRERDFSFPSGHTAAAFACAVTIANAMPSVTQPVFVAASLIAYSRIYLGIHYPSDVIAGWIIGIGLSGLLL